MPCTSAGLAVEQPVWRGLELARLGAAGQLPISEKLTESLARQAIRKCPGGELDIRVIAMAAGQLRVLLCFTPLSLVKRYDDGAAAVSQDGDIVQKRR